MNLYTISWTYGDHEMESDVYAGTEGTTSEGREYLLSIFTNEQGDGYMQEALDDPAMLTVDNVTPFTAVVDKDGNPYKVTIQL